MPFQIKCNKFKMRVCQNSNNHIIQKLQFFKNTINKQFEVAVILFYNDEGKELKFFMICKSIANKGLLFITTQSANVQKESLLIGCVCILIICYVLY